MDVNIDLVLDENPTAENDAILSDRLFKYETEKLLNDVPKHISVYLKDANLNIVGGALIWIHSESIYIPTLWVDEHLRRKGYGKKILQMAEHEAKKRQCKYVTLDANFESRSFYIKHGYTVIGEIENYIFNHSKTYFRKSLIQSEFIPQDQKIFDLNEIKLVPALLKDYPVIQNMARFYVYDMSEYLGDEEGWECPENGLYECIDFKKYWEEEDVFPFLIRYQNELVGFVIIDKKGSDPIIDFNMSQFFILRKFKNRGIGKYVAHHCFDRFQGMWEIMVIPGNNGAHQFWKSIIKQYTHEHFEEIKKHIKHFDHELRDVFCFRSRPF